MSTWIKTSDGHHALNSDHIKSIDVVQNCDEFRIIANPGSVILMVCKTRKEALDRLDQLSAMLSIGIVATANTAAQAILEALRRSL